MAEIINLRQQRKAKKRAEKDRRANDNRARHGRTKAEKSITGAQIDLEQRRLDGHKTSDDDDT